MSWLRIDDGFTKHPKFEGWTAAQKWAWLETMEYCARYRTDGRIPDDLSLLPRSVTSTLLKRAERSGLADRGDDGALWINDWAQYNPKDATAASRAKAYRDRNANRDEDRDAIRDETRDETVTSRARLRARSRPVPLRPTSNNGSLDAADADEHKQLERLNTLLAQAAIEDMGP